jgi:hypothetical protein
MPFKIVYPSSDSDEETPRNDLGLPVVLLLGWSGSVDRYLEKYSNIYSNRCIFFINHC